MRYGSPSRSGDQDGVDWNAAYHELERQMKEMLMRIANVYGGDVKTTGTSASPRIQSVVPKLLRDGAQAYVAVVPTDGALYSFYGYLDGEKVLHQGYSIRNSLYVDRPGNWRVRAFARYGTGADMIQEEATLRFEL